MNRNSADGVGIFRADRDECKCLTLFEQPDLEVFADSVLCYIKHCTHTVTVRKQIRVFPSQKPWMTSKVRRGEEHCF